MSHSATGISATTSFPGAGVVAHSIEHVCYCCSALSTEHVVEISLGTFLTTHGSPGTSVPAESSGPNKSTSVGRSIPVTTNSFITTCMI